VAKYRLNTCHQADLSGDDGGPTFAGNGCRSTEEYVAVSDPYGVAGVANSFGAPLTFFFPPSAPIPINASDLSLQVVFRGKLGQEDDAIAVTTQDVGEPNFVAIGNITDWAFSPDSQHYQILPAGFTATPITLNNITFSFRDPALAPALATLNTLLGGEHAQFAFISERRAPNYWLRLQSTEAYPQEDNVAFPSDEFAFDQTTKAYSRTCPVNYERGTYRQFFRYYPQIAHVIATEGTHAIGVGGGRATGISPKYATDCYYAPPPGAGGVEDVSYLTPPFATNNARQWSFNY